MTRATTALSTAFAIAMTLATPALAQNPGTSTQQVGGATVPIQCTAGLKQCRSTDGKSPPVCCKASETCGQNAGGEPVCQ